MLSSFLDLLTVVFGFSFIIFVHELGHFLAARWAGIRVLAFAIGFGSAVVSFRKGLGFRVGSSAAEYERVRTERPAGSISPTEYRLNWLPFGGYVRMLGQEDGDPTAVSDAPDSYQLCSPWKRMVVISAGVIMNVITAAILFVVVFSAGLKVQPPTLGEPIPGSPAARAGLRSGDVIIGIDEGDGPSKPDSFNDLSLAASMASRGKAIGFTISREGEAKPLSFSIVPEESKQTGLLELGLTPGFSLHVIDHPRATDEDRERLTQSFAKAGYAGLKPGMTLTAIDGKPATSHAEYLAAFKNSGGKPVSLTFTKDGQSANITVKPQAVMQEDVIEVANLTPASQSKAARTPVEHILGLQPVMTVADPGKNVGTLKAGDVFVRIGAAEFPSPIEGRQQIQSHAGRTVPISVLRGGEVVDFTMPVSKAGTLGIAVDSTLRTSAVVSGLLSNAPQAVAAMGLKPGSTILSVNGQPVSTLADLRDAILGASGKADHPLAVTLRVRDALPAAPERDVTLTLSSEEVKTLSSLGYEPPTGNVFEYAETVLLASNAVDAIKKGLRETRRVMLQTYMTFVRLFQGTVKVEHLKGPVGIAHVGTLLAERGFIWLLFFMALISVNLAVVNFLPLPIVDGGQFLFLLYEALKGKPVPMRVQEIATIAGLCLIGVMFLVVTFNDVKNLVGF